ncbi:unnamed protein product [Cladocopium goreaui]|uniref:Uncharacterized protein n=1 Tax=Cladocopium goreaui TaxID=2562237 RepID=A0A9P1DCX6_9DINO|nr:unnamed protein product [Cladocopium goreaui]
MKFGLSASPRCFSTPRMVERAGKKFQCLESYLESQRPMADGLHQLCHWNFVRRHGRSFVIPSRRTKCIKMLIICHHFQCVVAQWVHVF